MKSFEQLGESAYAAYCKAVGGTTFDGRPLPTFPQLGERQQVGWAKATEQVVAEYAAVH